MFRRNIRSVPLCFVLALCAHHRQLSSMLHHQIQFEITVGAVAKMRFLAPSAPPHLLSTAQSKPVDPLSVVFKRKVENTVLCGQEDMSQGGLQALFRKWAECV